MLYHINQHVNRGIRCRPGHQNFTDIKEIPPAPWAAGSLLAVSNGLNCANGFLCRNSGLSLFAGDGAVDGVDQDLGLDEFQPRPFRLVPIERRGQGLGEGVAVVGHALARLFQCLESLAHGLRFL